MLTSVLTPVGRKIGLVSDERWGILSSEGSPKTKVACIFRVRSRIRRHSLRRPETKIEDLDLGGEFAREP